MADNLKEKLGKKVKNLRKEAGLTQSDLAERVGVSDNYIGRLERGQLWISSRNLENLMAVFHLSPEKFFDFSERISEDEFSRLLDRLVALMKTRTRNDLKSLYDFLRKTWRATGK